MPDAIRHHLPSPQPSGTGVRIPAAVFGIALLARLLHLFFYKSSPYFIYPVVDAKVYLDEATRIAFGNWWQLDGVFYQAPLYQYFLAGTLLIGGLDLPLISRVIQALLGSATAVIVYLTARDLYQSRSEYQNKHASEVSKTAKPLIAGVLAAFYGPLIFFDCELLNPSLLLFFTYLCLYLLVREVAHGKKIRLPVTAIAGVCAGLSAITGGGILLFIPFFVYILLRRYSFNHALTRTITFICGIALVVLPVTVRNLVVGGEPVPISSNAGLNFFIGNNPDYESTVKTRPGIEWNRLANEPMDHDITTHRGYSSYFFKKSLRSILSDPAGYANVLYKKLAILVNAAEVPRNQEIYPIRSYSPVFAFLFWNAGSHFVFPFGFIFPFTCYFIIFGTWRKNPGYSLLLSFITSLLLFVFIFFVTSRYRLQAVPGLLILSSSGIWLAVNHLREKKTIIGRLTQSIISRCQWNVQEIMTPQSSGWNRLK